jgi:hypothetical protein
MEIVLGLAIIAGSLKVIVFHFEAVGDYIR